MDILVDGELVLYGFVGDDMWDEGFTDRQVLDALAELGRETDVTVRLNSGGGYTDAGKAIFNALKAHSGRVTVSVDGIAASAASIIAMAGDERIMRSGAMMMIHDASAMTIGTSEDHRKSSDWLDIESASLASIYAEVTGGTAQEMRALMREETWMTAETAVEMGFATRADSAKARAVAAFDYRAYAHAPDRLKRAARRKNWSFETLKAAASADAPTRQEEDSMTDTAKAEDTAAQKTDASPDPKPDLAAIRDEERQKAEATALDRAQARVREIAELCEIAGAPQRAAAFMAAGKTPSEVRATLLEERASADAARTVNSQIPQPAARGRLADRMKKQLEV